MIKTDNSDFRGSQYRGVSRNGKQWQMSILSEKKKLHIGGLPDAQIAGILSDISTI